MTMKLFFLIFIKFIFSNFPFQVIKDEDLVAILKDVSGDNYHEENHRSDYDDCDKRQRNLDFETTTSESSTFKMKKIRSTGEFLLIFCCFNFCFS